MRRQIEVQGVGIPNEDEGGDSVRVVLGVQKFAPVQYHSFDVGPFEVLATRGAGETIADVWARVMPELRALASKEYEVACVEFFARVKAAATAARGGR